MSSIDQLAELSDKAEQIAEQQQLVYQNTVAGLHQILQQLKPVGSLIAGIVTATRFQAEELSLLRQIELNVRAGSMSEEIWQDVAAKLDAMRKSHLEQMQQLPEETSFSETLKHATKELQQ